MDAVKKEPQEEKRNTNKQRPLVVETFDVELGRLDGPFVQIKTACKRKDTMRNHGTMTYLHSSPLLKGTVFYAKHVS